MSVKRPDKDTIKLSRRRMDEQSESDFWRCIIDQLLIIDRSLQSSNTSQSVEIELGFCGLSTIAQEIVRCKFLRRMQIYGNELSTNALAPLVDCKNLEVLDLSDNCITHLPADFESLQKLQFLDLSANPLDISVLDQISKLKQLKFLNLGKSKIGVFPAVLQQLKKLQRLLLYHYDLSYESLINICTWFPNLRELVVGANDLHELPDGIERLTKLTRLDLFENSLTHESIEKLSNLTSLKFLSLARNNLSTIPNNLKQLINLRLLDLSDNPFTGNEKSRIKHLLPKAHINFRDLD